LGGPVIHGEISGPGGERPNGAEGDVKIGQRIKKQGIPDARLKVIGYHFVAGIYDYMRLSIDDTIAYRPLAFQSMKNAFDTKEKKQRFLSRNRCF
jgi:hypothetical protein